MEHSENELSRENLEELNPSERRMATEDMRRLVLNYSLPTITGMLVNALYNVIDRFWIGKLDGVGAMALTGIGLVLPLMNIIMGLAQLVGIGAASCISIRLGKKDRRGAEQILNTALLLITIISVLLTGLGLLFAEDILRMAGASDATLPYALPYARVIFGGSIFQLTSFAMNHSIRATGNPKRFASTQMLGAIVNIILDPIFLFAFNLGTFGVGLATVIAQAVSAVWVFSYYFSDKTVLRFKTTLMKLDLGITKEIFAIGLSPFLMQTATSFVNITINHSLRYYGQLELGNGDIAIGAMTVVNSLITLFFMPVLGINQGTQPIIGFNYGRKDYVRTREAYRWGAIYATVICTVGFIVIQLFAPQLVIAFNDDPDLVAVASEGMRIFLFMLPLIGFQATATNFFQAIGRAKISILLSTLRQIALRIPLFLALPMFIGLKGIWYGGMLADLLSILITAVFIFREMKILTSKKNMMLGSEAMAK